MSETNRTTTIAVPEVTYGTTPVDSANWITLRATTNTLAEQINAIVSEEIRTDRQRTGQIIASSNVSGQIGGELSEDSWDAWIAAAMASTWTANVVKVGVLTPSYTVQVHYADIDKYIWFKGVHISAMNINFQFGQFCTITFDVMAKQAGFQDTGESLVGAGSVAAADTTASLAAVDVSSIKVGGTETTLVVPAYSISVNNNLRPLNDLRARTPNSYGYGSADVSGSFTAYFVDHNIIENSVTNVALDLDVTVALGGKSFQFDTPNARVTSGWPTIQGQNQDIAPAYNFTAFRDSGLASPIAITRVTT